MASPKSPESKKMSGFNSLPDKPRMGRRRSSLEEQLEEVMQTSRNLQVATAEHRRAQQQEIRKAEGIVQQCDAMVSIHQQATEVMTAMRFKRKVKALAEPSDEEKAAMAQRRKESKEEIMADLAKLQGMVDKAKQTTGMQTLAALWTEILKGKVARMVLHWNQNACGPKELDMPEQQQQQQHEEQVEEEDDYSCEMLVPAAPEADDYSCDVLAPAPDPAPQRIQMEPEPIEPPANPMQEYLKNQVADDVRAPAVRKPVAQPGAKAQGGERSRRLAVPRA